MPHPQESDDSPLVFTGGTIRTAFATDAAEDATTSALAIQGTKVIAIGDDANRLTTPGRTIDLRGGTLMPAPGEGHAHPMLGGLESQGPEIRAASSVAEVVARVHEWSRAHPNAKVIYGASFDQSIAADSPLDARDLDRAAPEVPVVLRARDYHSIWVNSAAIAALDPAPESDPPHGYKSRRADGTLRGTMHENAATVYLHKALESLPLATKVDAIRVATRAYARAGITWVQDAWVECTDIAAYLEAARQDALASRINLALIARRDDWLMTANRVAEIREQVAACGNDRLTVNTVKMFVDGILGTRTAALLCAYEDSGGESGTLNWNLEQLSEAALAFDRLGLQLHMHAIGDAANRMALDTVAIMRSRNGARDRRCVIAHVTLLDGRDVSRFRDLEVIANFEPFWAQQDASMRHRILPRVGRTRAANLHSIGSVMASGALVSFGSDWPVSSLDWRDGLRVAQTRTSAGNPDYPHGWLPEQRISAQAGLAAYCERTAYQAFADDRGTLHVGSTADMVLVSADPLTVAPEALHEIRVLGTWIAGTRVFTAD